MKRSIATIVSIIVLVALLTPFVVQADSIIIGELYCPSGEYEAIQEGGGVRLVCYEETLPTPTAVPPTAIPPTPTAIPPTPVPTQPPSQNGAIIIDHNSIALFDRIPDQYIQAASQLSLMFWHASVGNNIDNGLNCLANDFDRRPSFCDRDVPAGQVVFDPKYNRDNWDFEFHQPPPGQNPPWWDKVNLFISRTGQMSPGQYDYVSFKIGYVDGYAGSSIDDLFFVNNPNDQFPGIGDLRQVNMPQIYWTMGLARSVGTPDSSSFNNQLRQYAAANGLILMDIAAIESHTPSGSLCTTNGQETMCPDYTREINGGHLNGHGHLRMAKAMWVLMAQLAGWRP